MVIDGAFLTAILNDALASVSRVFIGSSIGAILGVLLGVFRFMLPSTLQRNFVTSLFFEIPKFAPPIAWIPFAILIFGVSGVGTISIVVIGVAPIVFTHTFDALRSVPNELARIADSLELSKFRRMLLLYLPAVSPQIFTGLRLASNVGWMCIIASEMMAADSGLGYGIQLARINLDYSTIGLYIFTIGIVGFLFYISIERIEKILLPWSPRVRHLHPETARN